LRCELASLETEAHAWPWFIPRARHALTALEDAALLLTVAKIG
jgi:hypothetical protein